MHLIEYAMIIHQERVAAFEQDRIARERRAPSRPARRLRAFALRLLGNAQRRLVSRPSVVE